MGRGKESSSGLTVGFIMRPDLVVLIGSTAVEIQVLCSKRQYPIAVAGKAFTFLTSKQAWFQFQSMNLLISDEVLGLLFSEHFNYQ